MEQCLQHSKENDCQPNMIYPGTAAVECEDRLNAVVDVEGVKKCTMSEEATRPVMANL